MAKLLVLIPAYNEAKNIIGVISNLEAVCDGVDYLILNDGSTDNTIELCKQNGIYRIMTLSVNLGLAGVFQAGVRFAYKNGYDYILQFDGDGQHKPEYIGKLIDTAVENDADIVIGSRFVDKRKPYSLRMIGSRLIGALIWLTTGKRIKDPTSGMRLYNRRIMRRMAHGVNMAPEPDTLSFFIKCKAKVVECQVEMDERLEGESYLNLKNSIKYMLHMICSILFIQPVRERKL